MMRQSKRPSPYAATPGESFQGSVFVAPAKNHQKMGGLRPIAPMDLMVPNELDPLYQEGVAT